MLSWGLYDLHGGFYGPLTQRQLGSRVELELCGQRRATLQLSLHDPLATHVTPLASVLRAWLDGAPIFAGVVGTPTFRGREQVLEIPAVGPSSRLQAAFVGQRSDGAGLALHPAGDPYRQEQQPEGEILWRLVDHAAPTAAEQAIGVPNHGIVRGQITPGQLRDRSYEPGKNVWEAFTELAAIGLDFDLEPIHDDLRPAALAQLHTVELMGRDLTNEVRLEFGIGANTASDLVWSPSAEIVNRMTGVGEAPAYDGDGEAPEPPHYTADQPDSQYAHGIYGAYEGLTGVTELTTIAETVGQIVATTAFPTDFFTVTPALQNGTAYIPGRDGQLKPVSGFGIPPRFGPAGRWWLGDSITSRGRLGEILLDLPGRVSAATIEEIDQAGNEQVTVTIAPRTIAVVSA